MENTRILKQKHVLQQGVLWLIVRQQTVYSRLADLKKRGLLRKFNPFMPRKRLLGGFL